MSYCDAVLTGTRVLCRQSDQHLVAVKMLTCNESYSMWKVQVDSSPKLQHFRSRCWWRWSRRYCAHVQHCLRWFKHNKTLKYCNLISQLQVFVCSQWVLSGKRLQHNGSVVASLLMPPECPQWQRRFKERTQRTRWSKERFICERCCCVECQRHVMTEIWC